MRSSGSGSVATGCFGSPPPAYGSVMQQADRLLEELGLNERGAGSTGAGGLSPAGGGAASSRDAARWRSRGPGTLGGSGGTGGCSDGFAGSCRREPMQLGPSWSKDWPATQQGGPGGAPSVAPPMAPKEPVSMAASVRSPPGGASAASQEGWGAVPAMPHLGPSLEGPSVRERAAERAVIGMREQAQMWERQSAELQGQLATCEAQLRRETAELRGRLAALEDLAHRGRITQEAEIARTRQLGDAEVARARHAAEDAQRQARALQLVSEKHTSREREELEGARAELARLAREKDGLLQRQREDFGSRLEEERRRQARAHTVDAQKSRLYAEALEARVADLENELAGHRSTLARTAGLEHELAGERAAAQRAAALEDELAQLRGAHGTTEARLAALGESWLEAEQRSAELREESVVAVRDLRHSRADLHNVRAEEEALRQAVQEARLHAERHAAKVAMEEGTVAELRAAAVQRAVEEDLREGLVAELRAEAAAERAAAEGLREALSEVPQPSGRPVPWEHTLRESPRAAELRRRQHIGALALAELSGSYGRSPAGATAGSICGAGSVSEAAGSSPRQPPQRGAGAGACGSAAGSSAGWGACGSGAGACSGSLPAPRSRGGALGGPSCGGGFAPLARQAETASPPVAAHAAAAPASGRCSGGSSSAGAGASGPGGSQRQSSPRRHGAGRLPSILEQSHGCSEGCGGNSVGGAAGLALAGAVAAAPAVAAAAAVLAAAGKLAPLVGADSAEERSSSQGSRRGSGVGPELAGAAREGSRRGTALALEMLGGTLREVSVQVSPAQGYRTPLPLGAAASSFAGPLGGGEVSFGAGPPEPGLPGQGGAGSPPPKQRLLREERSLQLAEEWEAQCQMEQQELHHAITLGEEWQERSEMLQEQLVEDRFQWQQRSVVLEEEMEEAARQEEAQQFAALLSAQQDSQHWQARSQILEDELRSLEQREAVQAAALQDAQEDKEQWRRRVAHVEEQLRVASRQEQAELRCLESDSEALRQRGLLLEVRLQRAELEREQGEAAMVEVRQEKAALQRAENNGEAWRLQGMQLSEQLQQASRERDRLMELSNELRSDNRRLSLTGAPPARSSSSPSLAAGAFAPLTGFGRGGVKPPADSPAWPASNSASVAGSALLSRIPPAPSAWRAATSAPGWQAASPLSAGGSVHTPTSKVPREPIVAPQPALQQPPLRRRLDTAGLAGVAGGAAGALALPPATGGG